MDAVRQKLAVVFFSVCWSSQVEAQGQGNTYAHFTIKMGSTEYLCLSAGVYLQLLGGARVPNHGFVGRGDLSGPTDNPLLCVTPDNITCCSTVETGGAPLGNWYFPNGTEVPPDSTGWLFYCTRGPGVVRLHRRTGGMSGIYHCVIPDQSGVNQTLYVGLYTISIQESGK